MSGWASLHGAARTRTLTPNSSSNNFGMIIQQKDIFWDVRHSQQADPRLRAFFPLIFLHHPALAAFYLYSVKQSVFSEPLLDWGSQALSFFLASLDDLLNWVLFKLKLQTSPGSSNLKHVYVSLYLWWRGWCGTILIHSIYYSELFKTVFFHLFPVPKRNDSRSLSQAWLKSRHLRVNDGIWGWRTNWFCRV